MPSVHQFITKPELVGQVEFDETADEITNRMLHGFRDRSVTLPVIYSEFACIASIIETTERADDYITISFLQVRICSTSDAEFIWSKDADWPGNDKINWIANRTLFLAEIRIKDIGPSKSRAALVIQNDSASWLTFAQSNDKSFDSDLPLRLSRQFVRNIWQYLLGVAAQPLSSSVESSRTSTGSKNEPSTVNNYFGPVFQNTGDVNVGRDVVGRDSTQIENPG